MQRDEKKMMLMGHKMCEYKIFKYFLTLFNKNKSTIVFSLPELPHEELVEPQVDKTNKVTVRPAKTRISLGFCPV